MKSRVPAAAPTKHAWLTPPAGPEKMVLMGRRPRGVGRHHAAARGDREDAMDVPGGEQALL